MIFPLMSLELCRAGAASAGGLLLALTFTAGVEGIMLVSGIMHTTNWRLLQPERARNAPAGKVFHPQWIRLLDYSMIFVGIGLLYSSMGFLIMGHTAMYQRVIAPIVWGSAALGIATKALFINTARWIEAVAFLAQGWACIIGAPIIREVLTPVQWTIMLSGGICFTLGVFAYVMQWPDFAWHRDRFRAHEVFHLGTVGGFGCFTLLMRSLLVAR